MEKNTGMTKSVEVINNKEEVPFSHYVSLFEEADPEEISKRLGIPFDDKSKELKVAFLGADYHIRTGSYSIRTDSDRGYAVDSLTMQTFILRYLLAENNIPFGGTFRSYQEMPWGDVYIKPFTGRVLDRMRFTYGKKPDIFKRVLTEMGGRSIEGGDAAFELVITDDYMVRIILWEADDEFPPSVQVLYSDNFTAFSAEDRASIGDIIINTMKKTEQLMSK